MTNRIMIDLETFGNTPGSVILSIGAVRMDPQHARVLDEFYVNVDPVNAQSHGLTIDAGTVMWWLKQSVGARARLGDGAQRLPTALIQFTSWMAAGGPIDELWANGAAEDLPWLRAAYAACGLPPPWTHRHARCYRTIKNLFPDPVHQPAKNEAEHDALADARWQAKHLMNMLTAHGCWQMGAQ